MLRNYVKPSRYVDLCCEMLQEIGEKQGARGIVNLPPGHLKSTLARLWAAWMLGRSPDEKIMVLSCSEGLAREFADGVRTTMKVPWYCELFPETRIKHGRGSLMDFLTTRGGGLLASPMGADITGRRADLLIVDDPVDLRHANDEERLAKANEYFDWEIMSRLNSRRSGRVLVVAHRIYENDVSGHCLRNGGYAHLSLPFITEVDVVHRWRNVEWFREAGGLLRPDAFSDRDVEEIRRAPEFPALWQQNPGGSLGALIGPEHFGSFDRRELPAGPVVFEYRSWTDSRPEEQLYSYAGVAERRWVSLPAGSMARASGGRRSTARAQAHLQLVLPQSGVD